MANFKTLNRYWRAANYLAAAQIYLRDNPLLNRPLVRSDIKERILGHWGTVAGQNFIYAHLSRAVKEHGDDIIYLSGPGHGGNFFIANAYLEGTYSEIYPAITRDAEGLTKLFRSFSFPDGVSSHVAPQVPGSMHEGGELGYSLAHGFGAVLDHPNLVAAVVVGDGEAETGPLATSWWGVKFLNPHTDGNVLPILHLNGYKIANPTLLARLTKAEREKYFSAFGYEVIEIEVGRDGTDVMRDHAKMAKAVDYCLKCFRTHNGKHPMIILNSPKGWTGPAEIDGKKIAGSFNAHQVPADMSKPEHLSIVSDWLLSYRPDELFNADGSLQPDIADFCPTGNKRISAQAATRGGEQYQPLALPELQQFFVNPKQSAQDMAVLAKYIDAVMQANPHTFRFFSPDEAKSNRLYAPLPTQKKAWQSAIKDTDENLSTDGRIIDSILSEHMCEGMLEGYNLTGRHGFFATYEAFARVVDSMLNQHAKWLKQTRTMLWRTPLPCLNLIATSHTWQQDHNGFTHQDTGIGSHLLDKDPAVVRAYYPADANTLLAVFDECMRATNRINVVTASKHPSRQWRTGSQALADVKKGISVWQDVKDPDLVLATLGDTPTVEGMAALKLLKEYLPQLKVRLVNIIDLGKLGGRDDSLTAAEYAKIFTNDRPVIFVSHTYENIILALTAKRPNSHLYTVLGYHENGAITTAFDMRVMNGIDRFHIVKHAVNATTKNQKVIKAMDAKLKEHHDYIIEHGVDPEWLTNF